MLKHHHQVLEAVLGVFGPIIIIIWMHSRDTCDTLYLRMTWIHVWIICLRLLRLLVLVRAEVVQVVIQPLLILILELDVFLLEVVRLLLLQGLRAHAVAELDAQLMDVWLVHQRARLILVIILWILLIVLIHAILNVLLAQFRLIFVQVVLQIMHHQILFKAALVITNFLELAL